MKNGKIPEQLLEYARSLRSSQTDAENLLWMLLRSRRLAGFKFRRQHPVGKYILDFYCHEVKLAVELDGSGHNDDKQACYDNERSINLMDSGFMVLRFWNDEVLKNTCVVLEVIYAAMVERQAKAPSPLPLSQRERG